MKKQLIKYIILLIVICSYFEVKSQFSQEFSFNFSGGISNLKYKTEFGNSKYKTGALFGLGYTYFINENIGFVSGAEFSLYRSSIKINSFYTTEFDLKDHYNDVFNYNSHVSNYDEKHNALFLNIPIMITYQTYGKYKFYASGGVKLSIPINNINEISNAKYENDAYYIDRNNTLNSPEFMGLGEFTNKNFSREIKYITSVLASIEAGFKFEINSSIFIYTGFYVDYGFSNIIKSNNESIISYNHSKPIDFINKSILESSYVSNNTLSQFTNKVIPITIGLKLRLAFGM